MPINLHYEDCPKCGNPIDDDKEEGDHCEECDHTLTENDMQPQDEIAPSPLLLVSHKELQQQAEEMRNGKKAYLVLNELGGLQTFLDKRFKGVILATKDKNGVSFPNQLLSPTDQEIVTRSAK